MAGQAKNIWIDDTNSAVILLYKVSGLAQRFCHRRYEPDRGGTIMNIRKLALFAGGAVIVAGGVLYSLGIYLAGSPGATHMARSGSAMSITQTSQPMRP